MFQLVQPTRILYIQAKNSLDLKEWYVRDYLLALPTTDGIPQVVCAGQRVWPWRPDPEAVPQWSLLEQQVDMVHVMLCCDDVIMMSSSSCGGITEDTCAGCTSVSL